MSVPISTRPLAAHSPAGAAPAASIGSSVGPADYQYLCQLVRTKSAIELDDSKQYLVESRLGAVLRESGIGSIAELVLALRGRNAALELKVVDAMTTNETSWFRDIHPFDAMRTVLLPELIERRRSSRELTVWCAASSSGQEPYSLSMMMREHFPVLHDWRVKIQATDISPTMIERVKSGTYSQLEMNRGLPASYLVRYFERVGASWQVRPEVRAMVEPRLLNLAEPWPTMGKVDVVFLRNVLIYFNRDTKRQILDRVRSVLRPDGVLILGSSETTFNVVEGWTSRTLGKAIVYQPT